MLHSELSGLGCVDSHVDILELKQKHRKSHSCAAPTNTIVELQVTIPNRGRAIERAGSGGMTASLPHQGNYLRQLLFIAEWSPRPMAHTQNKNFVILYGVEN